MINKEDIKLIEKWIGTIEAIVTNKSFSILSPEFKKDLFTIADRNNIQYCKSCNSGIYQLISKLYKQYNDYKIKLKRDARRSNRNSNQESGREIVSKEN